MDWIYFQFSVVSMYQINEINKEISKRTYPESLEKIQFNK